LEQEDKGSICGVDRRLQGSMLIIAFMFGDRQCETDAAKDKTARDVGGER
jgi:hypothetical protein